MAHRLASTAALALTLAALGACQDNQAPTGTAAGAAPTATASPTPPAEPKTVEAAKAVVMKAMNAAGAGDFAGHWDTWTAKAKGVISRDDFERLYTKCKQPPSFPFTVTDTRVEGDKATVVLSYVGFPAKATAIYEAGAWRFQPDADDLAEYRKGVDKAVASMRAKGGCKG